MNEVKVRANKHILEIERRTDMLNELVEFKNSLLIPGLDKTRSVSDDLVIGVFTSNYPFGIDHNQQIERTHSVRLQEDLGITRLQETFKAMLLHDVETRIEEVKKEINNLIGDKNND